jgi:hypothetical protein
LKHSTSEHAEKPKKKTPLKTAKAAASPDAGVKRKSSVNSNLFSLFRVAKHWKELPFDYLHQLLNQDTCCCGCNDGVFKKLDESDLDRFLGFHFCTKTKLRLAADWCKYRYGENCFVEADSHPCKTCGTPAHLTLQVLPGVKHQKVSLNAILLTQQKHNLGNKATRM